MRRPCSSAIAQASRRIPHPRCPARRAAAQAHLRRAAGEGRGEVHREGCSDGGAPRLAPPFVMHGARDAIARRAGAYRGAGARASSRPSSRIPALAFDLAKDAGRERVPSGPRPSAKIAISEDDDLPEAVQERLASHLPFLPADRERRSRRVRQEPRARRSSGLSTAIQGICELRNQCGFALARRRMQATPGDGVGASMLLAAEAADTIVGFLHRVAPAGPHALRRSPRALYDDNRDVQRLSGRRRTG